MITNPGKYEVNSIIEYGLLDKEGKESVFLKFDTMDGPYTWFGSLNGHVAPGKKMSGRDVTLQTMTKLGWDGDIDKFVNKMATFALPAGTEIEVGDDEYAPGKVSKAKVLKVFVPGFGGGQMEVGKAKSLLSGMKADIAKAQQSVAIQKTEPDF